MESLSDVHGIQDRPAGGNASSLAGATRTHDGRVDGGDSPEAHATFGATLMPSQVTHEQPETGVSRPQTTYSANQCGWSDGLREALEEAQLDLGDLTIEQIVPSCRDDWVRSVLDLEYEAWLPSRERRAPGSRPGPQRTEAQDRPRVRHRAQYARFSGSTLRTDPAVPKMSSRVPGKIRQLSCLWRRRKHSGGLFEKPSVPDNRCLQPVGPPKWELMAPITAEDVERSLKGMKDGAPGPDGRKLKDVRAISFD